MQPGATPERACGRAILLPPVGMSLGEPPRMEAAGRRALDGDGKAPAPGDPTEELRLLWRRAAVSKGCVELLKRFTAVVTAAPAAVVCELLTAVDDGGGRAGGGHWRAP